MSYAKLQLDHAPTFVYHPQSKISGLVICHFFSEKDIRKIRVRLIGKEHTEWRGTQRYYDSSERRHKTRHVHFEGDHEFMHYEILIKGPGTIPKGKHSYPFKFTLPQLLPGSLTHNYGYIRYFVEVTVDRPWKIDYEDKMDFKVFAPLNLLNSDRRLMIPIDLSDEKTICCFCCASGPITVDVKLEKRAFAIGEKARMRIYCVNMSNANVEQVKVQILMNFEFKVRRPEHRKKEYSEVITTWHETGVGAHGDRTYDIELLIPQSTDVPNFALCDLFSQSTLMKITVVIDGAHSDIEFKTPVALGHIPIPTTSALPPWSDEIPVPTFENATIEDELLPPYPLDPHPTDDDLVPPYPLDPHPTDDDLLPPYPSDAASSNAPMPQPSGEILPVASAPCDNDTPSAPPDKMNGLGVAGPSTIALPSYDEATKRL